MSAPPPLSLWRDIIVGLFPWLEGVGLVAGGGLAILAEASKRLHLQGGAGDPAAARNGDEATRIAFYPGIPGSTPPSLWYSYQSGGGPYTWRQVAPTIATGPIPTDPGTPIKITGGSTRVTIG